MSYYREEAVLHEFRELLYDLRRILETPEGESITEHARGLVAELKLLRAKPEKA